MRYLENIMAQEQRETEEMIDYTAKNDDMVEDSLHQESDRAAELYSVCPKINRFAVITTT
jgi:hypothetical protein